MGNWAVIAAYSIVFVASKFLYAESKEKSPRAQVPSVKSFRKFYSFLSLTLLPLIIASCLFQSPWLLQIHELSLVYIAAGLTISGLGFIVFTLGKKELSDCYSPCYDALLPPKIVSTGIYSYIRHPIYTGNLMLIFGAFICTGSLLLGLQWCVLLMYYVKSVNLEEQSLQDFFGLSYQKYALRTGKFLPRLINVLPKEESGHAKFIQD